MKRVKKMVAMATVMTMVFNVVMPIGVLAKENTNEYGVLAKNGANFSGSGQIIGDIVINNGTLKYSNSLLYSVLPTLLYSTTLNIGWVKNSVADTGLYSSYTYEFTSPSW